MILRPSNAYRWGPGGCPGSPKMQALYPDDQESESAREGTAAHFWATEAVEGRFHPVGTIAPNGHPIDVEMTEAGQWFVNDVMRRFAEAGPRAQLRTEQALTMHGLVHPQNEGTTDAYLIDPDAHRIVVWDFKYGHRDVDPFRNWQVLDYLAGVFEAYELTLNDVKGWEIFLVIVQPRNYRAEPVREWRMLGRQAWDLIAALAQAAEAATHPDAPCVAGDHCRDCSAAHACPAALAVGANVADFAARAIPNELSDVQLSAYLRMVTVAEKRLKALRDALEEVAISKIRGGAQFPHWTLGRGTARERWKAPVAEVVAMGKMLGVDLAKPEAITPNQAREALTKMAIDPSVISEYAEKPQGAIKLLPLDETQAAKAFS